MARDDRRDSFDEKLQKNRLKEMLKEFSSEYHLELNLSEWEQCSHGNSRYATLITEVGDVRRVSEIGARVRGRDSKNFDGFAEFSDGKKECRVFFILKKTYQQGGSQDGIDFEITRTIDNISLCTEDDCLFFFLLEGNKWNSVKDFSSYRFGGKAILLPRNENDDEIKKCIFNNLKIYFNL